MIRLAAALTFSLLASGCSSVFYQPSRLYFVPPSQVGLKDPTDIFMRSGKRTIHGWFFEHTSEGASHGLIVFFHGNAQNITSHYLALRWILDQGFDYFIFDYAGYGRSEGFSTQKSTIQDGVSAVCWALKHKSPATPLIVFGQSLGGAIALRTAAELKDRLPLAAVVVDSTFYSYRAVARKLLSSHWLTWWLQPLTYLLVSDRFSPEDTIPALSPLPLLVIHGDQDRHVGFSLGQRVFELAGPPKEFLHVEGGRHIDAFFRDGDRYQKALLSFFDRYLPKTPVSAPVGGELFCNQTLAGLEFGELRPKN